MSSSTDRRWGQLTLLPCHKSSPTSKGKVLLLALRMGGRGCSPSQTIPLVLHWPRLPQARVPGCNWKIQCVYAQERRRQLQTPKTERNRRGMEGTTPCNFWLSIFQRKTHMGHFLPTDPWHRALGQKVGLFTEALNVQGSVLEGGQALQKQNAML